MSTKKFYEALAPHYHLIFKDWDASMRRQGRQLKQLIRREAPKARLLLDRACGIGTQALPLAKLGFEVRGEDISPKAIQRARREAKSRGLTAKFAVADMRRAPNAQRGAYDVVIACDNAIPHLLDDAQIVRDTLTIVVQVNGKLRAKLDVATDTGAEEVKKTRPCGRECAKICDSRAAQSDLRAG
jgi:2-polyprenyl-3-methyl-5-hydroxy-6-metoxy-1,4-benzoquinol methylase